MTAIDDQRRSIPNCWGVCKCHHTVSGNIRGTRRHMSRTCCWPLLYSKQDKHVGHHGARREARDILYGDHEQTKNHDVISKHDPAITRAWRVSPDQGRPRRWKAMQVDCVQFPILSRPWAFPPRVTRRSVTRHRACTGRGLCSKKRN
jgi:hypothetical protein